MTLVEVASLLRADDGTVIPLDVRAWSEAADAAEHRVLDRARGPVLDIGCGPGRLVIALAERGIPALGVDASSAAVDQALGRQATALVRSVFDPIPGTGRWATALLFDGNVGIGGDPVRLLARVHQLLARDGRALVETTSPTSTTRSFPVRIERGDHRSPWFPWAQVAAGDIEALARRAGFGRVEGFQEGDRWFAQLERGAPR